MSETNELYKASDVEVLLNLSANSVSDDMLDIAQKQVEQTLAKDYGTAKSETEAFYLYDLTSIIKLKHYNIVAVSSFTIEDVNEDNKENTIEDNKENMDLTECGEGTKLEIIRCYKEKAVEYKLPEICDNLEEEAGIRTQCYINYIKKTDDLSQCINVDESFDFQKICEGKY